MLSKMKGYQRNAEAYERRWNNALKQGNIAEAYTATEDYKRNIKAQEEELKQMDPNSKEYAKAEISIAEQQCKAWDMGNRQRSNSSNGQLQTAFKELSAKNTQISHDMSKAVERGDAATYDSLRAQYEKNIFAQERLEQEMKFEDVDFRRDIVHREKVDLLDKDVDMRHKINEKIAQQEVKGKKVNEEDRAFAEKYTRQVKMGQVDLIKYQNNKQIENMVERGASKEAIKAQEEENKRSEKWVESISR